MKVEILPRADADIIRQFRYYLVDRDTPETALRFRQAVRESLEQLMRHPGMGAPCRCSIPGLRSWPIIGFAAFRVYYVEATGALQVVRILHGRRNVRRILRQEAEHEKRE